MLFNMGLRHAAVVVLLAVLGVATWLGFVGPAVGTERITSLDVVVAVREDRVEIREAIDWDFGGTRRRGIIREIPSADGAPTDVRVESPSAPDDVLTSRVGGSVEVRIGDPDVTISGRHRYVISYSLPRPTGTERVAVDAVGTEWEVPIERASVTVVGAVMGDTDCFVGLHFSTERCALDVDGGVLRTTRDDLPAHEGITIEGDVISLTDGAIDEPPPFTDRDAGARLRWAGIVTGLAGAAALVTFSVCRGLGRNEVAGGGATDAAFAVHGRHSFGPEHPEPSSPPPPTTLVADSAMGDLAGIEFVPPAVEPWQAAVCLRERIDDRTVGSWFSSLAGHDIVRFETNGDDTTMVAGPEATRADPIAAPILERALGDDDRLELGDYSPSFAAAWRDAGRSIDAWVQSSEVFRRRPPTYRSSPTFRSPRAVAMVALMFFVFGSGAGLVAAGSRGLRTWWGAVFVAVVVGVVAALGAYRVLTRSLSWRGSAIALRAESFRRFLHASEAQHVEWAWENGLLREYSAWAVALGEADAWNGALVASSVPPPEVAANRGVLHPGLHPVWYSSSINPPAPSGGGGGGFSGGGFSGGGFSGGGIGGGGGRSW